MAAVAKYFDSESYWFYIEIKNFFDQKRLFFFSYQKKKKKST